MWRAEKVGNASNAFDTIRDPFATMITTIAQVQR